jgi:hypothetical protein
MIPRYVAMWSGPRNISTAMLRSWGSRADTFVVDEPFYAHYLLHSHHREEHPGADEIISTYETDWREVAKSLTGAIPDGKSIFYQKHMTHHMLDHIDLAWTDALTNCFLLREPREVLTSFIKVIPNPQIDQTGLPQQIKIFEHVRRATGKIPPVLDSADVLKHPRRMLTQLCEAIEIPFDDAMLKWEMGSRATDGIWAKYWYAAVENSTGFAPYQPKDESVPDHLHGLLNECERIYREMYRYRLGQ